MPISCSTCRGSGLHAACNGRGCSSCNGVGDCPACDGTVTVWEGGNGVEGDDE